MSDTLAFPYSWAHSPKNTIFLYTFHSHTFADVSEETVTFARDTQLYPDGHSIAYGVRQHSFVSRTPWREIFEILPNVFSLLANPRCSFPICTATSETERPRGTLIYRITHPCFASTLGLRSTVVWVCRLVLFKMFFLFYQTFPLSLSPSGSIFLVEEPTDNEE